MEMSSSLIEEFSLVSRATRMLLEFIGITAKQVVA